MDDGGLTREALWFTRRADGKAVCSLCPHGCVISEGGHGVCKVRFNRGGTLRLPFYGRISALAVDPIEKKPLYHFYPGSHHPVGRIRWLLVPLQVLPELADLPVH